MTSQDIDELTRLTCGALKSDFGFMGDLPLDLANTVANIYFRYFQQGVDSAPPITLEELVIRQKEYEAIQHFIAEFRSLRQKGEVSQFHMDILKDVLLDTFKYRILDAGSKMPIRRMMERKFRKTQDIPDLVKFLQLYQ